MYPMKPPEPKWIDWAHFLYIINYDLRRGEDQMGMNPSPEILKKIKIKKNWLSHNIELLGMEEGTVGGTTAFKYRALLTTNIFLCSKTCRVS